MSFWRKNMDVDVREAADKPGAESFKKKEADEDKQKLDTKRAEPEKSGDKNIEKKQAENNTQKLDKQKLDMGDRDRHNAFVQKYKYDANPNEINKQPEKRKSSEAPNTGQRERTIWEERPQKTQGETNKNRGEIER